MTFSADGTRLYVVNNALGGSVAEWTRLPTPVTARTLVEAFDAVLHGDRLYVTQFSAGAVQVIDAATRTAVETLTVNSPFALAADGDHIYVATADGLAVITSAGPSAGSPSAL